MGTEIGNDNSVNGLDVLCKLAVLEKAYQDKIKPSERFFLDQLEKEWSLTKPFKDKSVAKIKKIKK